MQGLWDTDSNNGTQNYRTPYPHCQCPGWVIRVGPRADHFRSSSASGQSPRWLACLKGARTGLGEVKRSPCGFSAISPSVITHLSLLPCQPNRERLTIFIKKALALVIQTRRRQGRTTSC